MHNLPIGPYHPALKEPESFVLQVEGEEIVGARYDLGYNHRGIEKFAVGKEVDKTLFLAERVCGICSQAHSSCYCYDLEKIFGAKISKKAEMIRTIMAELARMHNHLFAIGLLGYQMGFKNIFMWCWDLRETPLALIEKFCGNRYHAAINQIGGVRYDITGEGKERMDRKLGELEKRLVGVEEFFDTPAVHTRLDGLGIISKKEAEEIGVVGPVARGSGIEIDERTNYGPYDEMGYEMVVGKRGDVWERNRVRLEEVRKSIRMVQKAELPEGKLKAHYDKKAGKERFSVEAPRGRLFHTTETDGKVIKSLSINPPTPYNIKALEPMLQGAKVADATVVLLSIDPCFACNDRALVIENGKKKVVKFDAGKVVVVG